MRPEAWLESALSHAQQIPATFENRIQVLQKVASSFILVGDIAGACQVAEEYIPASNGQRETIYAGIARRQIDNGDMDTAEITCQSLIQSRQGTLNTLASSLAAKGNLAGAWRIVGSLNIFDSSSFPSYAACCEEIIGAIITFQVLNGDILGAEASMEKLVALVCGAESQAAAIQALVRAQIPNFKTLSTAELADWERAIAYSRMAVAATQGADADSAFKWVDRMTDPLDKLIALCDIAKVSHKHDRGIVARRAFAAAKNLLIPIADDQAEALSRLAHTACEMGEIDQALEMANKIPVTIDCSYVFYWKGLGGAPRHMKSVFNGVDERVRLFCEAAVNQANAGRRSEAEEILKRCMQLAASIISSQDRVNRLCSIAEAYIKIDRKEVAHDVLIGAARALRTLPVKEFGHLHSSVASPCARAGFYEEAKALAETIFVESGFPFQKLSAAEIWEAIAKTRAAARLFDDIRAESKMTLDPILSTYYCLGVAEGMAGLQEQQR